VIQDDQITSEAAAWFAAQRRGPMSVEEREQFDAWRSDWRNQAALDEMHQLWGEISSLRSISPPVRRSPLVRRAAAAIFWLGVAGFAAWSVAGGNVFAQSVHTEIGEQSTTTLGDGSVVALNVVTRVDYRIGAARRQVWLKDGEAMFFVQKDEAKPFIVHAGDYDIRATGTAFNVLHRDGMTEIAVSEGSVVVQSQAALGANARTVSVVAGQKLVLRSHAPTKRDLEPATPSSIAEWRMRAITYEDASIGDIVKDVNRFYPRPLTVTDPALAQRRVTLRLQVEDRDRTLGALAAMLGVTIHRTADTDVLANGV